MFTGIVVEQGTVSRAREKRGSLDLEIDAPRVARDVHVGDSVAVNGVCLTAVKASRRSLRFEAIEETLARSTLGSLKRGGNVNLELAARLADRLGGHLVQGHVDGLARVVRIEREDDARRIWFEAPAELLRYLVAKGSVALDGVSLTVVDVGVKTFQVALIPHTLSATTLGKLKTGSIVNVEVDVIAKYVERLTEWRNR
ncbi:MAG: riboflavin synthase [Actinobacteria bacterium]|nr:riboflavin synthase [Actinomycetota bacterium]